MVWCILFLFYYEGQENPLTFWNPEGEWSEHFSPRVTIVLVQFFTYCRKIALKILIKSRKRWRMYPTWLYFLWCVCLIPWRILLLCLLLSVFCEWFWLETFSHSPVIELIPDQTLRVKVCKLKVFKHQLNFIFRACSVWFGWRVFLDQPHQTGNFWWKV